MTKQLNAVVLFSGGFDSVALYHHVAERGIYDNVFALYIEHGNVNNDAEMERIAHWMPYIKEHGAFYMKFLNNNVVFPAGQRDPNTESATTLGGESTGDEQKDEYVAMRNLQFLASATAFAEMNDVRDIYIGLIENHTSYYPDTSPLFLDKANDLIRSISGGNINLQAPFIHMTKLNIADFLAETIGKDAVIDILDNTITCNTPKGTEPCNECNSCKYFESVKELFKM